MVNTAIILAGGLGTRLRPLTDETPKPLLPINGKPILHHVVEGLMAHGVEKIVISIGYMAEQVQEYFNKIPELNNKLQFYKEDEPLGTGGAVKKAAAGLTEPFFLIWGDNLSDTNFSELRQAHLQSNKLITMTLTPREDVENFGVAKLDGNNILTFVEKPKKENAPSNLINAGALIVNPKCLEMLPEGKSSIERQCFEQLAAQNEIYSYVHNGTWLPTDTVEKYIIACKSFNPKINTGEKKVIVADVDGTICESCQEISPEMADKVNQLISKGYEVAFVSGSPTKELIKLISTKIIGQHYILGNTGTNFTIVNKNESGENETQEVYNHKFTDAEKQEIIAAMEKVIAKYNLVPMTTKEDQLQDRNSQISLSALGRFAPHEAKKRYDPDLSKRREHLEYLKQNLDESKYEFGIAGTTSIDVTRKGVDKEWAIREFAKQKNIKLNEIIFFGDKIFPGGNDYPAARVVDCIPVNSPKDALNNLNSLF